MGEKTELLTRHCEEPERGEGDEAILTRAEGIVRLLRPSLEGLAMTIGS